MYINKPQDSFFVKYKNRLKNILDIKSDTNKTDTINTISRDVYLRGSNIIYLVCSAILASVGLDVNSPGLAM